MDATLATKSLDAYLEALASNQPTPGGGAAAAITAAQGTALLCMVCRLTLNKRRFAAHKQEISSLLEVLETQRQLLLHLAQEDIDVFQEVIRAYQLRHSTEEQLIIRTATIQLALKAAAEVPLELFKICNALLPIAEQLQTLGNPAVISDVTVAKHLLNAGLWSAKVNVEVNLAGIVDQDFCRIKRDIMQALFTTIFDN